MATHFCYFFEVNECFGVAVGGTDGSPTYVYLTMARAEGDTTDHTHSVGFPWMSERLDTEITT